MWLENGATVSVSGTITITQRTSIGGGEALVWLYSATDQEALWWVGSRDDTPPKTHPVSATWTHTRQTQDWLIEVRQEFGANVEYNLTVTTTGAAHGDCSAYVGGAMENQHSGSPTVNPTQCQSDRPVNCYSGDFWHSFGDLAIPGRGPDLDLNRTYNSDFAAMNGPFGYGWSHSYGMKATVAADGDVTITEEGGTTLEFTSAGSGSFTALPRVLGSLSYDSTTSTYTFTRRKRDRFVFDSTGRLIAQKDLNGYTVTLAYQTAYPSRLATVTDSSGRTLTFTYTGDRITGVADSGGRSTSYVYNAAGELTETIDARGGHWTFTYDASHRVLTMREPKYFGDTTTSPAPVTTNHYDAQGRVDWQSDPLGQTTSFDYTSIPGSTKVTDPRGNVTAQKYTDGTLTEVTKGYGTALAATWKYSYDPETFNVTPVEEPNGAVSLATYDADGNQLTATDALLRSSSATYNSLGLPLTVTDPASVVTTMTYDAAGNLQTASTPLVGSSPAVARSVTYGYDPARPGDVTSVTDPDAKVWAYTYDTYGNTSSATDPLGNKTTSTHDTLGRTTSVVAPKGNVAGGTPSAFTTTFTHNAFGQVLTVTDPLARVTTRTYDANGNLATEVDPENHTTTYGYDANNQLRTATRANASTLGTGYDAGGNVASQTDGANRSTTYGYDALDRLSTVTDPLNRVTTYGYDSVGNLTTKQDPGGNCAATPKTGCTTFGYDAGHQLKTVTYSDGITPNVTNIGYDNLGRRTSMTDGTGTSSWAYDSLGRLTSNTNGAGSTVSYGYNLRGLVTSVTYPGGTNSVTKTYDNAGRLATVTDWLGNAVTYTPDANSNVTALAFPAATSLTETNTFNNADELMSVTDKRAGISYASFAYTRDDDSSIDSVTSTGVPADNHSYGYNAIHQLTAVDATSFTFDAADNLTTLRGTSQSFDVANQLTNTGYAYDTRGNRTSGFTDGRPTTYTYDQANRLKSLQVAASPVTSRQSVSDAGVQGNGASQDPSISSDGNVVVFHSVATNLVAGDTNAQMDVFTRNRTTSAVVRASVSTAGVQGNGQSDDASVSADGRYVAFRSLATNLVTGDTNAVGDIFLRDTVAGTTTRVSVSSSGVQGNAESIDPYLSGDGRYVVYRSSATNLVTGDTNARNDVFLYDRITATTSRVSVSTSGAQGGGDSSDPTISSDGRYVAFTSTSSSSNLVPGDTNGQPDVYVRDRTAGTTTRVSVGTGNVQANGVSNNGMLAANGTKVAFRSLATNLVTGDTNAVADVFVHDLTNGTTVLASATPTGAVGNGESIEPSMAGDGSAVAFHSYATNLVTGDTNAVRDVFVRNLATGVTTRASLATDGTQGTSTSADSYLSGDGSRATFSSHASNLVTGDTNAQQDVFVRDSAVSTTATYAYRGDGLRASKTVNGATTSFVWDESGPLPLLLSEGSTNYVYGAGGHPIADVNGSTVRHYHQDQLGSTRVITSGSGATLGTFTYDAYGKLVGSTGAAASPFGWAGEYRDAESGLVYLRARYLDPTTAQFVTRDPVESLTRSPYGYTNGNPVAFVDPMGLCSALATLNPWAEDNCVREWAYENPEDAAKAFTVTSDAAGLVTTFAPNPYTATIAVGAGAVGTLLHETNGDTNAARWAAVGTVLNVGSYGLGQTSKALVARAAAREQYIANYLNAFASAAGFHSAGFRQIATWTNRAARTFDATTLSILTWSYGFPHVGLSVAC